MEETARPTYRIQTRNVKPRSRLLIIALLCDIHGNLPALESVLAEAMDTGVDRIMVGGDVLPGPFPGDCLDALTDCGVPVDFIHGNGEREVLATLGGSPNRALPAAVQEAIRWVGDQLDDNQRSMIGDWPGTALADLPHLGAVFFCHATPENDTDIFTRDTPAAVLEPLFRPLDVDLVCCGHTHMSFDRVVAGVRVVNPGSVGMPFDEPGAYWAVLGADVELRRTRYDLEAAAAAIRNSGFPGAAAFADRSVLNPPSAEDMLHVFNDRALGQN